MKIKSMRAYKKEEDRLQQNIATYLLQQYPDVVFTSESSGLRLTPGQAVKAKKMRSDDKLPDMIILQPNRKYYGMMLELKKNKDELYRKDGKIRQAKHIQGQKKTLEKLRAIGYYAEFVWDFDQAKKTIDDYMKDVYYGLI